MRPVSAESAAKRSCHWGSVAGSAIAGSAAVAREKASARVGTSVAALHTRDRDEPVAGAPGEQRVYTFMCSDLEADVAKQTLCLPK